MSSEDHSEFPAKGQAASLMADMETNACFSPARWQVSSRSLSGKSRSTGPENLELEPLANSDTCHSLQRGSEKYNALTSSFENNVISNGHSSKDIMDRVAELVRWIPGSNEELFNAEDKLLSFVKSPHELVHVSIGPTPDLHGRDLEMSGADVEKPSAGMFPWMLGFLPALSPGAAAARVLDQVARVAGFPDRKCIDDEGNCYINTLLVGDVAKTFTALHPKDEQPAHKAESAELARRHAGADVITQPVGSWFSEEPKVECRVGDGGAKSPKPAAGSLRRPSLIQRLLSFGWRGESSKLSAKVGTSESDSEDIDFHDAQEDIDAAQSPERDDLKAFDSEDKTIGSHFDQDEESRAMPVDDALESEYSESSSEIDSESESSGVSNRDTEGPPEPLAQAPWPAAESSCSTKPNLVMVHGYAACLGFFFRNYDTLAEHFNIYAIDQLGWGASSRPSFTPKTPEESENWFVEALELWREEVGLQKFVLLGHSFGGYISARYALRYPQYVEHLILVGPAGFNHVSPKMERFKQTWKGMLLGAIWETNVTPQLMIRCLGPFSEDFVKKATRQRWSNLSACGQEDLPDAQVNAFSDYIFQSFLAPMSGEFCMKYIFSLGAFARRPLIDSAMSWLVPTTFIYGEEDIMDYRAGLGAAKFMPVAVDVLLIKEVGHMLFIEKPTLFNQAVVYGCRALLPNDSVAVETAARAVAPFVIPLDHNHEIPTDVSKMDNDALFTSQGPGRGTVRLASGWGIG